jgi:hypothetical protein
VAGEHIGVMPFPVKGGGKVEQECRGAGHDDIIAAVIANSVLIEPEAAAR